MAVIYYKRVKSGKMKLENVPDMWRSTVEQMLKGDEVTELIGHAIGGVCPFANPEGVRTYLDISLQRFDTVFPACGSSNSAIELHCDELFRYALAIQWIDVCK